eukprot:gene88-3481_t
MATTMQINAFFSCEKFIVLGASADRTKFGNKVFRALLEKFSSEKVLPVNPRLPKVEGVKAYTSALEALSQCQPETTAVSVITPPSVTLAVLQQVVDAGVKHVWLQPGAEDKAVLSLAASLMNTVRSDTITSGGGSQRATPVECGRRVVSDTTVISDNSNACSNTTPTINCENRDSMTQADAFETASSNANTIKDTANTAIVETTTADTTLLPVFLHSGPCVLSVLGIDDSA